jgi:hypothetical protein
LCQKFTISENFDVIDCEGIDKLIAQVPVRLKESGLSTIGIIIDADIDIKGRWGSLSSLLSSAGFTVPPVLPEEGVIVNNGIRVGIWIMPNNRLNGMLEDFISFLIPKDDPLLKVANNTLDSIEQLRLNKYAEIHRSKALMHSWLAWQEDPGTPMGLAITKRYLTTDYEICQRLINWLINTFK